MPSQYDPAGLTEEQIAKGGELFRTNCSACHNFAGKGGALSNGVYAPPLTGTGVTNAGDLGGAAHGPEPDACLLPVAAVGRRREGDDRLPR